MAYCRFSDGDVYLYYDVGEFFNCCACRLRPLIETIMTKGYKGFSECTDCDGVGCEKCWCDNCKGEGCEECMMRDNLHLSTAEEAIEHLEEHVKAGHAVPSYAFDRLKMEIEESSES